jgi:hypothetical protein
MPAPLEKQDILSTSSTANRLVVHEQLVEEAAAAVGGEGSDFGPGKGGGTDAGADSAACAPGGGPGWLTGGGAGAGGGESELFGWSCGGSASGSWMTLAGAM